MPGSAEAFNCRQGLFRLDGAMPSLNALPMPAPAHAVYAAAKSPSSLPGARLQPVGPEPEQQSLQRGVYVTVLTAVAAMGGFLFGFDSGVINGTVEALGAAFGASELGTGFSVASMLLGCAGGAFFAGAAADRFGRRRVMTITALLFLVSAWGSGAAADAMEFVLYRIAGGFGVGAASVIAPMYIAEVAPPAWRGRLGSVQQLAIVIGLLMAFVNNYVVAQVAGGASASWYGGYEAWRWMLWAEMVPAAAFLVGSLLVPESPRYLVATGRDEDARRVFARIEPSQADQTVAAIRAGVDATRKPRLRDLWDGVRGRIKPVVWVAVALGVFQQFVGINVIFYYGAVLWQAAGFSEEEALLTNIISGCVNLAATLPAMALIDRAGRRPLLLYGALGMAISLATVAWVFADASLHSDGSLSLAPAQSLVALIAAHGFIMCFAASWGPVLWVVLGEIFDNQTRGSGMAISTMIHWVGNFAVTMSFPIFLKALGLGGAYALYALTAALAALFVARAVQETRGRSLEEAQAAPTSAAAT